MTPAEMQARIAELERQLDTPTTKKAAKARERARRRQFQIDRWRRERRHLSLNRYAIGRAL